MFIWQQYPEFFRGFRRIVLEARFSYALGIRARLIERCLVDVEAPGTGDERLTVERRPRRTARLRLTSHQSQLSTQRDPPRDIG